MCKQMTNLEKNILKTYEFDELWQHVWGKNAQQSLAEQYKNEECASRDKFNMLKNGIMSRTECYTLDDIIEESNKFECWDEAEWGFPKGRRNSLEKDFDCAVREFCEETGYSKTQLVLLKNILPFEEIFTGSNYKSYKHKYYIMFMSYDNSISRSADFQKSEVGECCWKSYEQCMSSIRNYNLEKKHMLTNINTMLMIMDGDYNC